METIWLQRSSPDVPWGFRLVGGREFGVPLCVQRVTPGSVAAAALGPGDEFLKVGNVVTSDLPHTDAMELVKQAGNILQLTIRKGDPSNPNPMLSPEPASNSPPQFNTAPRDGGYSSPNSTPNYSTTPRNLGSQYQPAQGTKIEIQRVDPPQQQQQQPQRAPPQRSFSSSYGNQDPSFPDYTIPYKQQDPIHDSPGGPVDLRVREDPPPARPYMSRTLPRGSSVPPPDRSYFNGTSGPPAYAPPGYSTIQKQQPLRVKTGLQFHITPPQAQRLPPQQRQQPPKLQSQVSSPAVNSTYKPPSSFTNGPSSSGPLSPQSYSTPVSPQGRQPSLPQSQFATVDRRAPSPTVYNPSRAGPHDQSNLHGSGPNIYATLPHSKPATPAASNNNNNINKAPAAYNFSQQPSFNKSPQPFSAASLNVNTSPAPGSDGPSPVKFSPAPIRSFQSPMASPGSGYQPYYPGSGPQPGPQRRLSLDQGIQEAQVAPRLYQQVRSAAPPQPAPAQPAPYSAAPTQPAPYSAAPTQPASYSAAPAYSEPAASSPYSPAPSFSRSNSQQDSFTPAASQYAEPPSPAPSRPSFSRQSSQSDPYAAPGAPRNLYNASPTPYGSTPTPYGSSPTPYGSTPTPYGSSPTPYGASPTSYRPPPTGPLSPMSPRSDAGNGYGPSYGSGGSQYRGYDPSGVSAGMNDMSIHSPTYEPQPPPPVAAPPPPPPPPPPGPPPPPAPPLNNWSASPYRRPSNQSMDSEEGGEKIPDQLLSTMLNASKGGGPKPFSYGIDMSELKKKMGPPTAPKPRGKKSAPPQRRQQQQDTPPSMPQGPKKQAGHVQSDYFLSRDEKEPRGSIDQSSLNISMGNNPKKQSKSFKILQWLTETDREEQEKAKRQQKAEEEEEEEEATPPPPQKNKRRVSRDSTCHNADDDEMRFSGLHSKKDIPSKTFNRLQKMPSEERKIQEEATTNGEAEGDEDVGNYNEASIRYKGKSIPSPSFRILQSWAENDPENYAGPPSGSTKATEEEDDDLPDTLSSEDMANVRYKGGNIPSKLFKTLQRSVGDDTPTEKSEAPAEVSSPEVAAPAEVTSTPEPDQSTASDSVIVLDTPVLLETPVPAEGTSDF